MPKTSAKLKVHKFQIETLLPEGVTEEAFIDYVESAIRCMRGSMSPLDPIYAYHGLVHKLKVKRARSTKHAKPKPLKPGTYEGRVSKLEKAEGATMVTIDLGSRHLNSDKYAGTNIPRKGIRKRTT